MGRAMKKMLTVAAVLVAVLAMTYGVAVWRNNSAADTVQTPRLEQSLSEATEWLVERGDRLVEREHTILWWMLREAAILTQNEPLASLVGRYRKRWVDPKPLWRPLFEPDVYAGQPVIEEDFDVEPYQWMFVYGVSCDTALGKSPIIRPQLEPDWCGWSVFTPRCVTHQLLAMRLMQRTSCGDPQQVDALAEHLKDRVEREAIWDPRVTDGYMQRVLMLLESGEAARVKPVWVARILDAQNSDGGWDDLDPLLPLPGDKALGWTSTVPTLRAEKSTFHATVQGVWIVSLLLAQP